MKTNPLFHYYLLPIMAIILLSGCFSINNFQSAKTLKKSQAELGVGVSAGTSFTIDASQEDAMGGVDNLDIILADFILFGRYGISDNVDVGLRFSSVGDLGADFKFMAVGDQESKYTLSPGLGFSTNSWLASTTGIFQVEVPLHNSYNISDNFTFVLTPRYVGQTSTSILFANGGWIHYVGGTAGFEVGKNIKFNVGVNYLKALEYDFFSNFNVGMGVRFRFGGIQS